MAKKQKTVFFLILILLCGFGLRFAELAHRGPGPSHECLVGMDETNYRELASNILKFHTFGAWGEGFFVRSTRAPGYPLVLAAFCRLSFFSKWAPEILNLMLDTLNIFLIFLLCRTMYGRLPALTGAAAYAIFAPAFLYICFSSPEILAVSLVLSIALCFVSVEKHYWRILFSLSVLYALLIHSRPSFLPIAPVVGLIVYFLLPREAFKIRALKALLPLLLIFIFCLPWGIRNYMLYKAPVPVCTVAGWHLATRGKTLSKEAMTDYLYRPEHKNYSEGDFYKVSMRVFQKDIITAPVSLFAFGFLRMIYGWSPPGPWYRFMLPRAYLAPVSFSDNIVLPLPDFEAVFYLIVIFPALAFCFCGRRGFFDKIKAWGWTSRAPLLLTAAYVGIHVLGVPFSQYRFIVEPLFLALAIGLFFACFASPQTKTQRSGIRNIWLAPAGVTIFMLFIIAVPLAYKSRAVTIEYPTEKTKMLPGFKALRDMQWEFSGNLPANAKTELCGVVKYLKKGYTFPAGAEKADKKAGCATAKMVVNLRDKSAFLGQGDVKLNFANGDSPDNGAAIRVIGNASVGLYKDIIVDVEKWEYVCKKPQEDMVK